MSKKIFTNILIIGSGPAGYTAAIYAARANLKPHLVSGLQPGGQMTITTDVENYPGFGDIVQGPWLMEQMRIQAEKVGTIIHDEIITNVNFESIPFTATTDDKKKFECKSVIISTGAEARWLKIDTEEKFKGFGISACATCDGFFFKDKKVAVIGGGNSAVEEALYLTNFVKTVTLIHRRDSLRAEKILQDRLFNNPKVNILWNKKVIKFIGKENPASLEKILLEDTTNKTHKELSVSGAFIAIGHDPATSLFVDKIKMDKDNYIITQPDSTQTNINGVFAAGDVKDKIFRQAVTAAGMGCMAALEAEKYLAQNN